MRPCVWSLLAFFLFATPGHSAEPVLARPRSSSNLLSADLRRFQLGPGLKIEAVAGEPLLENPVAFSIDGRGRFFVAETHRYRDAIFDITANTPWLLDDLSFRDVTDRAAFLARTFATNFAFLTNSSERIRLVEDRDGDGTAESSSVFADDFRQSVSGTAAGVLAQGSNVWFACIPDLWRFTIDEPSGARAGGTPRATGRTNLATGLGVHISVSGHDVHGLIRGPDGRIYFSFGDRGIHTTNREGDVLNVPDTGGVLRCEPDGKSLEIFCRGLRNPQELAFDDYGNLWTVDNDTAGADPCRVLQLREGADYGWRGSYQHMKGFGPWVQEELWRGGLSGILPPAGTVSQGPAGLAFYPGSSLLPEWSGRFFHADFPGGVWAYGLKPRGAGFELADKQKVLWGCWPTDVDFGPDGALYVLDWVQGWTPPGKGRIYRITSAARLSSGVQRVADEARRLLREGMSHRKESELASLLGHEDRRVRLESQWELAGRGSNSLAALVKVATSSAGQLARIHALWGIRQVFRPLPGNYGAAELASLLPLLEDKDPEIRGQAALALGEGQLFNAEKPLAALLLDSSPRTRMLAIEGYTARWKSQFGARPTRMDRLYFSRTQKMLGGIADKFSRAAGTDPLKTAAAVGAVVSGHYPAQELNRLLPANRDDPFIQQAVVHFLAETRPNSAFESHYDTAPSVESALAILRANTVAGRPGQGDFFTNHHPRIILETARAIHDTPLPDAYPALAAMLDNATIRDPDWGRSALSNITPAGPFSAAIRSPRDQVLRRALNAHYRLGFGTNAEALARFASDQRDRSKKLDSLRAEALFLLGSWGVAAARPGNVPVKPAKDPNHGSVPTVNPENWPGWFDRVTGAWRPMAPRPPQSGRIALEPFIGSLVKDPSDEVSLAAIDAAMKLQLTNAAPFLLGRIDDSGASLILRQRIPSALAILDEASLRTAIPIVLRDTNQEIRAAVFPYLSHLKGDTAIDVLRPIVRGMIGATNVPLPGLRLAQSALDVLGQLDSSGADPLLQELLTEQGAVRYPPGLELNLLEAAARRDAPGIKEILSAIAPSTNTTSGPWRPALIGGDAARGRAIFFEKVEVQCSRCHLLKRDGGTVGPALDGIGGRQSREQLLESILLPNKAIAPGYESVLLTLKNGEEIAGVLKKETADALVVESPETGVSSVPKATIVERRRSLSAMPEGVSGFLTRREMRDLIEFLATER